MSTRDPRGARRVTNPSDLKNSGAPEPVLRPSVPASSTLVFVISSRTRSASFGSSAMTNALELYGSNDQRRAGTRPRPPYEAAAPVAPPVPPRSSAAAARAAGRSPDEGGNQPRSSAAAARAAGRSPDEGGNQRQSEAISWALSWREVTPGTGRRQAGAVRGRLGAMLGVRGVPLPGRRRRRHGHRVGRPVPHARPGRWRGHGRRHGRRHG